MSPPLRDVLIVGAGPAASATAIACRRRGLSVQLVGLDENEKRRMGESLLGAARSALHELGLSIEERGDLYRPSYLLRSAWAGEVLERSSMQQRYGADLHLDRARFDAWLLECARDAGAEALRPARVIGAGFDRARAQWRVRVTSPGGSRELFTRYLVDATGRSAWLSRTLGATRQHVDHLVGVVRWFREPPSEPLVLVEASEHGWWYSAPIPNRELVVLFTTDAATPAGRALRSEVWDACLAGAPWTRARLDAASALDPARGYAVSPAITQRSHGDPWLAVGDAAVAFDPLSGTGLCFALRSALEAAEALVRDQRGDAHALRAYRAGCQRVFQQHLAERAEVYASETRWPRSAFWSQRGAPAGTLDAAGSHP
jgi:flavin-dependent dehydrogenase